MAAAAFSMQLQRRFEHLSQLPSSATCVRHSEFMEALLLPLLVLRMLQHARESVGDAIGVLRGSESCSCCSRCRSRKRGARGRSRGGSGSSLRLGFSSHIATSCMCS